MPAHATPALAKAGSRRRNRTDVDVAIIGAGSAGLTAALEFKSAGLSCTVLEARPHWGGRIQSAVIKGEKGKKYKVDLGGSLFYEGPDNPLARNILIKYRLPFVVDKGRAIILHAGRHGTDKLIERQQREVEREITKRGGWNRPRLHKDAPLGLFADYLRTTWYAATSRDYLAPEAYAEDSSESTGWMLKQGSGRLMDCMAKDFGTKNIRLKMPVTGVARVGSHYRLHLGNGGTLDAGMMLSTQSIGVLQSGITAFDGGVMPRAIARKIGPKNLAPGFMEKSFLLIPGDFFREEPTMEGLYAHFTNPRLELQLGQADQPVMSATIGGEDAMKDLTPSMWSDLVAENLWRITRLRPLADSVARQKPLMTQWRNDPYIRDGFASLVAGGTRPDGPLCNRDGTAVFTGEWANRDAPAPAQMGGSAAEGARAAYRMVMHFRGLG